MNRLYNINRCISNKLLGFSFFRITILATLKYLKIILFSILFHSCF